LFSPPVRDCCVVSTQEDFWNLQATECSGTGELRVFQPTRFTMRFIDRALLVTKNSGDQPDYGIYHYHSGNFSTIADEVPNGNLKRVEQLPDAIVEPLVPPAEEQETGLNSQLLDHPLVQPFARRGKHNELPRWLGFGLHRIYTIDHRLSHQDHSGSTAKRSIIDSLMLVLCPVADVPGVNLHQACLDRIIEEALADVTVEYPREQSQNVEPDGSPR
jgi:hypothetical protein